MLNSEILQLRFQELGLDLPSYCVVEIPINNRVQYECSCEIPDLDICELGLSNNPTEAKELVTSRVMQKIEELNLFPTIH
ncbi:hypothetical protein OAO18_05725 [Francisellaceae bacterium]|nr:hypothetical protein [Francisellaceae bacterium]